MYNHDSRNDTPDTPAQPEMLLDNLSVSFKDEIEVQPLSPIHRPKRQMTQPLVMDADELLGNVLPDEA